MLVDGNPYSLARDVLRPAGEWARMLGIKNVRLKKKYQSDDHGV